MLDVHTMTNAYGRSILHTLYFDVWAWTLNHKSALICAVTKHHHAISVNLTEDQTFDMAIADIIIMIIINTLQHINVDGLPVTCAGSQTKNLRWQRIVFV